MALSNAEGAGWLERPVYVSGLMKSGTTLLLGLLDGHSKMLAYPDEPSFERLFLRRHESADHLAKDWLWGTPNSLHYNPIVRDSPAYPKGYSHKSWEPIPADFDTSAFDLRALRRNLQLRGIAPDAQARTINLERYHETLEQLLPEAAARGPKAIVAATMLSLRAALQRAGPAPERWLFKQPLPGYRDQSFRWFFNAYPEGRAVVLLRDPRGMFSSLWRYRRERRGPRAVLSQAGSFLRRLSELDHDFTGFHAAPRRFGQDRVLIVYYEDLVADTRATMDRVAKFCGLHFEDILLKPTKLGEPVLVPTATRAGGDRVYGESLDRWKKDLTPFQLLLIEATLVRYAAERPEFVPLTARGWTRVVRLPLAVSMAAARPFFPPSRARTPQQEDSA